MKTTMTVKQGGGGEDALEVREVEQLWVPGSWECSRNKRAFIREASWLTRERRRRIGNLTEGETEERGTKKQRRELMKLFISHVGQLEQRYRTQCQCKKDKQGQK